MLTDKITSVDAPRGAGQKAEREALRNLTAAQALSAQKAMRDAELAKTKRLRALRLAKEAEESETVSGQTRHKVAKSRTLPKHVLSGD